MSARGPLGAALAAALASATSVAAADAPPVPQATGDALHWAVGVGGHVALTGPGSVGPAVALELFPGGPAGRWGVRAAALGLDLDRPSAQLVTGGASYSAASARPNLHLALHADIGAAVGLSGGARAAAGGGLQAELWLLGPIALGFDATAHLLAGNGRLTLALAGATTLRLSY